MRSKLFGAIVALAAFAPAACSNMGEPNELRLASGNLTEEDFAKAKELGDPIVCVIEHEKNTRIKRSQVCKHRSAWDKNSEIAQREFGEFRRYQNNIPGG